MMRKRSDFERRQGDFYPTPRAAVPPLISHLGGVRTFAEPCAGKNDLIRHLESYGLRCTYAGDIRTGQDTLALGSYGNVDAIITNPPHSRGVMHELIAHFARIAPTWLLIDLDWTSTKQAEPFLPLCSDIVAIGRVKWIEGSRFTGKDNFVGPDLTRGTRASLHLMEGEQHESRTPRLQRPLYQGRCVCGRRA
jgi:hypothetical protein